jgi:hypothetical protein
MTTFLLLLSLMLNAAAIFAIILLYLRQNRLVESEKKQQRIITEIEEVFSAYLLELKEENEKFIQLMKADNPAPQKTAPYRETSSRESMNKTQDTEEASQTDKAPRIGKAIAYNSAMKAYRSPSESEREETERIEQIEQVPDLEDLLIKTESAERPPLGFNEQVADLQKQGFSVEEIARRLNKGKTEIELLLKFRQNT